MAYSDALWQEAKKKCRLSNEDIKIAKELGLNPKSLYKNKNLKSLNKLRGLFIQNPLISVGIFREYTSPPRIRYETEVPESI